jgi:hypothetical protein
VEAASGPSGVATGGQLPDLPESVTNRIHLQPVTPVILAAVDPAKRGVLRAKASSGCFVGAAAAVALLGFGLLATLLSVVAGEPAPPPTAAGPSPRSPPDGLVHRPA